MANNYQVQAEDLTEGRNIVVRGKLVYSRLIRPIDGEELARRDQQRMQSGGNAIGKPHTTVTLAQPAVQFADAANPTPEETYVNERFYLSKKNPTDPPKYSIDSKGNTLPVIALRNPDGTFTQDQSKQELAAGLDVSLVLRTYKSGNYAKRGIAIDQVIVHDPVRYYSSAGAASLNELANRGIVFTAPPTAFKAGDISAVGEVAPVEDDGDEAGVELPQAQPAPVAAPVAQPAAAQPAPAQPAPAAAQPEMTVEQQLALLKAQNEALRNAQSAIAPVQAQPAAELNPWGEASADGNTQAGITFPG